MTADDHITFLILLNEGDLESSYGVTYYYRKHFGLADDLQIEGVGSSLSRLERDDVIYRFDIENDGDLDSALYDHDIHGDIKFSDLTIIGLDDKFCLGRRAIDYALEHRDVLCEKAIDHGFNEAASVLTSLPIDCASWTGFDSQVQLDEIVQLKLLKMLKEAEITLSKSMSNNREVGQGLAYVRSAIILCEAPSPPKRDIWIMVDRAASIAGLAQIFSPIIALFTKH